MLDMDEIRGEILRLESGNTTYSALEKLSVLYTVMANQGENGTDTRPMQTEYSYAAPPASEFLEAMQAAPLEEALQVLDEHMSAVLVLYPKEYNAVMKKIKALA